jgi:hypothetical protein
MSKFSPFDAKWGSVWAVAVALVLGTVITIAMVQDYHGLRECEQRVCPAGHYPVRPYGGKVHDCVCVLREVPR